MDYWNTGAVNKTYAGALPEADKPEEHGHGHETTWHDLYETVVGQGLWEKMPPVYAHASKIIML